jgi:hypothetical protein
MVPADKASVTGKGFMRTRNDGHTPHLVWMIPAATLTIGLITVDRWLPEPFPGQQAAKVRAIEAGDKALCRKFGIRADSDELAVCQADLLKLRDREAKSFF